MSRWEVEDEDWDRVRDQLKESIIEVARRDDLIAYSDLIRDVPEIDGPQSHALAEMLGEIGGQCYAEHTPLLSALVVYKDRNKQGPGPGFYEAAARLGLTIGSNASAREEFWWAQVGKCYEHWKRL
ncbi:hypothetical protein [Streptomyces sp. NPDC051554]|uniref:hypothetical protein n=1 Tax=Streptomyces sp. NPDC051554 TaxID=3365656 RepID=UPI00379D11C1